MRVERIRHYNIRELSRSELWALSRALEVYMKYLYDDGEPNENATSKTLHAAIQEALGD